MKNLLFLSRKQASRLKTLQRYTFFTTPPMSTAIFSLPHPLFSSFSPSFSAFSPHFPANSLPAPLPMKPSAPQQEIQISSKKTRKSYNGTKKPPKSLEVQKENLNFAIETITDTA